MVKALVVEDEEDIRNLLVEQLLDKGCQVRKADNGDAALQRVNEEIPDIIFVDIVMPVMDGILFISELRKKPETSKIPVVLVSAIDLPGLRPRAKMLGVNHLLSKPWDLDSLDRMLQINNEWEIPDF
ncbi:MAG: response regulator [Chloroflexi bacterium]|nr:response regulator [Chloroflexota bacterium]